MDENQRPTIEVAPRTSSLAMYKALIKKEEEKEGDNNMRDEEEEEEVAAEDVIRNTSDPLPPLPVHALAGVDSTADSNDPIAAAAAVVVVVVEEERNGEETVVHEHFESAQKLVRDLLLFRESISQVRRDNQLLFHLNRLLILRYLQKQAIQRAMKSVDEERLATNTAFCLHASALDALDKNKEEEETILFSYLDKIQESRSLVKELHLSTKEIDRLKCDQKKQTNPVTSTIPASSSPSSSSLSSAIALLSSHHSPAAQSPTSFKHLLNLVITSNTPSPSSLLTPLESKTLCLANASHFKHRFLTLATNVHTHLAHLIAKRAALTRAIEKCLEHAEENKRRLVLEAANDDDDKVNKLIPWNNTSTQWDVIINVRMKVLNPKPGTVYASNPSTVFDAIKSKRQFDDICSIQTVDIELKCMLKPFGRGTFRSAYYAVDNKGYKLVVKHFHPGQGINEEMCAVKTARGYYLCSQIGSSFTKELSRLGMRSNTTTKATDIQYVPSWVAYTRSAKPLHDSNTSSAAAATNIFQAKTLMIEPHIPTFTKWTNNEKWVAEGQEGELMTAYSHYTYARSGRTLMVTDHQGHKEIKASSSPTPSSSSFPSSPHELFVLTDPAIHLIPEEGKYPILDDMSHPLDGNRRKYGVREFASRHVCSHICIGLGLNPK